MAGKSIEYHAVSSLVAVPTHAPAVCCRRWFGGGTLSLPNSHLLDPAVARHIRDDLGGPQHCSASRIEIAHTHLNGRP